MGVVDDGGCERVGFGAVDHPKLIVGKHRRSIWPWLGIVVGFRSFRVIPGTIPAEFEFHSKFRRNDLINLAGPSAKFDSSRIPGITRIPPDSGRNQWRTIKTSNLSQTLCQSLNP